MANEKELLNDFQEYDEVDFNFDELEAKLQGQLEEELEGLEFLKEEKEKIGNPDALGEIIKDVISEQFENQIIATMGDEFIKKNGGLTLDLRDSAHIQTPENFDKGKIATHNYISKEQLEKNYDRYKNMPHGKFRDEYVDKGMDATLKRAGKLKEKGIDTVTDIYTGRQIPTEKKLESGKDNPKAAQREHVKPSAELYKDPSLQMANTNEELAAIINNPENLQGYTTAERNNRKNDNSPDEMSAQDKNKHWEKANERAEEYINQEKKKGEERLKQEGRKTQKEELYRISGTALKTAFLSLLAALVKEIIAKLVLWFKSADKNTKTFIEYVKTAIKSFVSKLKSLLTSTTESVLTTIATTIIGPVIGTIKKTVALLKQGWQSLKEAVQFIRKPENRGKPLSYLLPQVGIIVISGLTGIGAVALGEIIEKALDTTFLATPIPLLGSPANLIGMLMGAIVCGILGAIAINLINKFVEKKQKSEIVAEQINKGNEALHLQHKIQAVNEAKLDHVVVATATSIKERHTEAANVMHNSLENIVANCKEDESIAETQDEIDNLFEELEGE